MLNHFPLALPVLLFAAAAGSSNAKHLVCARLPRWPWITSVPISCKIEFFDEYITLRLNNSLATLVAMSQTPIRALGSHQKNDCCVKSIFDPDKTATDAKSPRWYRLMLPCLSTADERTRGIGNGCSGARQVTAGCTGGREASQSDNLDGAADVRGRCPRGGGAVEDGR